MEPHAPLELAPPLPFAARLQHDPRRAQGLALIQASKLALPPSELTQLERDGVVLGEAAFPSFVEGYVALYAADLPLFISADSILHAVHRSYEDFLASIETEVLAPAVRAMLVGLRDNLAMAHRRGADPQACADLDLYLAVALRLAQRGADNLGFSEETLGFGARVPAAPSRTPRAPRKPAAHVAAEPVAGADGAAVRALCERLTSLDRTRGVESVDLFGTTRAMDLSQFAADPEFSTQPARQGYFRAFRWLNAASFHVVARTPDDAPSLDRRQLAAARLLATLLYGEPRVQRDRIAAVLQAWVGAFDGLTVCDVDALVAARPDATEDALARALVAAHEASEAIEAEPAVPLAPPPLARCRLLGGCFAIDSWAMHRLVYNRVGGGILRTMPDPLDVAYTAIGNDHAAALLSAELARYPYASDLAAVRARCDARANAGSATLYDAWLAMLRALSPRRDELGEHAEVLPDTARCEPWARRVLNTQLASWAELRHAARLYVKQSRTWGFICSFPDAYVEPCPAFFAALQRWAQAARATLDRIAPAAPALATEMEVFFGRMTETGGLLGEMATRQRAGLPLSPEHLRFANQAVTLRPRGLCAPLKADGWFPMLYRTPASGTVPGSPVVAVHTDDLSGRVLHVGTANPRQMVMTVSTPQGVRAFAGLASSFRTLQTEDYEVLTDHDWASDAVNVSEPPAWLQRSVPSRAAARVIGEPQVIEYRDDGFHLEVDPAQWWRRLARELARDVRDPATGAVIARRGESMDAASARLIAAGVRALPIASRRLLGAWLDGVPRDADGNALGADRERITGEVLERLKRAVRPIGIIR